MTRSRYRVYETTCPHFLTCSVVAWTPVFALRDAAEIVLESWRFLQQHQRQKLEYIHLNPVKRGYVDDPTHWRYSSARNYAGLPGLMPVVMDW